MGWGTGTLQLESPAQLSQGQELCQEPQRNCNSPRTKLPGHCGTKLGSIAKISSSLWGQVTQEGLREQTQTPHLTFPGTNGSANLVNLCVVNDTKAQP